MTMHQEAILVLTREPDPTADAVIALLHERGVHVVKLDAGSFPCPDQVAARWHDGALTTVFHLEDAGVDLSTLRSIWYRRPREFTFSEDMTPDTRAFAAAEARQGFAGALMTSPATWMNRPQAEAIAALKMVQLQAASRRGLTVPETLITNQPDEARAFMGDAEDTVYKRLSPVTRFSDDGRLSAFDAQAVGEATPERLEQVALTPCLFQRPVPVAERLRITVVGDEVHGARVGEEAWESVTLTDGVVAAAGAIVADLGLRFAGIDMARRPDGELVFLELCSAGQWTSVQDVAGHPVREAIVRFLANPAATARGADLPGRVGAPA